MRAPRLRADRYRQVTLVAVFLLAAIIVTGGAVRLTGSGLGCPEWPNCEPGSLTPRAATDGHAMVEFVNRVFTGAVSIAVIAAVLGSLVRIPRRRDLVWLSLGLVIGVVAQAVLGGVVVAVGLKPPFVMAHFLLSLVLLADAIVLHDRAGHDGERSRVVSDGVLRLGWLLLACVSVVVVTGTVVTATGPHAGDERAERFKFALSHVARVHGVSVMVFLAAVLATMWLLNREGAPTGVRTRLGALLAAILFQAAVGYIQYFNGIPAALVAMHLLGATVVFGATLWFLLGLWGPAGAPEAHNTTSSRPMVTA
jgi:cytochrome c oxidase assembly protein subunit 15